MIAFGASITDPDLYERYGRPGIERAAERGSPVFAHQVAGSIFSSYNLLLDQAAALEDLEALVLVHQDAEILDVDLCAKLRVALRDPDVGVVGSVGSTGAASLAWWEGTVAWGSAGYRYGESGGGELGAAGSASLAWPGREAPEHTSDVETVDGFLLALSPWVVRNVRFDESMDLILPGFDVDLCRQVRAAGRRVVTADLRVTHHHSLNLVSHTQAWLDAHMRLADKWEPQRPDADLAHWKPRARRAEAEAAAAYLLAFARYLQAEAAVEEHQRRVRAITESASWRLTAPLRRISALRAGGRGEHG